MRVGVPEVKLVSGAEKQEAVSKSITVISLFAQIVVPWEDLS